MRTAAVIATAAQRGMALISSLLLLVIVTILALSMFRSFGLEEKIAGNVREKERALHAAEAAQQYAEYWLVNGGNSASLPVDCTTLLNAGLNEGQICSNVMLAATVRTTPWPQIGVAYNPGNAGSNMVLTAGAAPGVIGTYYALPQFYIADVGPSKDGKGEVFQIDALGYGANSNSVAVVESTFSVSSGVTQRDGL
jgi:type IV pilus assembly protein PilX